MLVVKIETDGAAFQDSEEEGRAEVARILEVVAAWVSGTLAGPSDLPLFDVNGNRVGSAEWVDA